MAATVKNLVVGNTGIEFEIRNKAGEFLGRPLHYRLRLDLV
jgi:hypothetical protein